MRLSGTPPLGLLCVKFAIDRTFLRLVKILRADEPTLERPKQQDARANCERQSGHHMNPIRGVEAELEPQSESQGGERNNRHRKERGPVGRIRKRVVEATGFAFRRKRQEPGKQMPLLTAGA